MQCDLWPAQPDSGPQLPIRSHEGLYHKPPAPSGAGALSWEPEAPLQVETCSPCAPFHKPLPTTGRIPVAALPVSVIL